MPNRVKRWREVHPGNDPELRSPLREEHQLNNGNVAGGGGGGRYDPSKELTVSVVITCIAAASSGLIFGYDVGISGGVSSMDSFLSKFFPSVASKIEEGTDNVYCQYKSEVLTAFTSSLYLAGLVSSLGAGWLIKTLGRRDTMMIGGLIFFLGSAISRAVNVVMLIFGRILLGFGVGLTNQATPIYLSEMAPPKWRGAFNAGFQFFQGIGVIVANLINYYTNGIKGWGWRLSLGLAIVPAIVMTTAVLFIPDSPTSLVQRGYITEARLVLLHAHGPGCDVDDELANLVNSDNITKSIQAAPFRNILRRRYRPQLVMVVAIALFQQLTGIDIVAFYAPILLRTTGLGSQSALLGSVILGLVNLISVLIGASLVDRFGRKVLFIEGGLQSLACLLGMALILGVKIGASGENALSAGYSLLLLVLLCVYAAGFGWSWGPLFWLVPSEILPLEVRPAGQSIAVAVNFAAVFLVSQTLLAVLCGLKYGAFLFFGGWMVLMTAFIGLLLPETKGVSLESMHTLWEQHWYWRRFVLPDIGTESKPTKWFPSTKS